MKTGIELITDKHKELLNNNSDILGHQNQHHIGILAVVAAGLATEHTQSSVNTPYGTLRTHYLQDGTPTMLGITIPKGDDTIENLTLAGALLAAEIDRLQKSR